MTEFESYSKEFWYQSPDQTLRNTWLSQQQHNELQQQPQSSEVHVVRGTGASWKKRSIQSSEIDLRVDGISQEEICSDKQHMDEVKKQLEKLQDESKSQIMNKDLQKKGKIQSKETSLKI